MPIVRIGVNFTVDHSKPPILPFHDALEHLKALVFEAPTYEHAEHYADVIRKALEHAGR